MGGIAWTEEEDHLLKKCIEQYGEGKWHRVPQLAGLNRCRKSCRLRWLNYLRPNIKRGSFSQDEVELIIKLHKLLGNRWSLIAARLPGRTANDVKNYWNCHLSKKLNAQSGECDMNGDHDHEERQSSSSCTNYNEETVRSWPLPGSSSSPRKLHQKACAPYDLYTTLSDQMIVPAQEESCSTFTTTPMLYMDDQGVHEQNNAFHDVQHVNKYPDAYMDPQQAGFAADEFPTNFHVDQQVKAMPITMMVDNSYNNWEWDDLISEMDLWNA